MKRRIRVFLGAVALICSLFTSNMSIKAAPVANADSAIIEINSYEIVEGSLNPGEKVTLRLRIRNTNKNSSADNIVMSYESTGNMLFSVYGEDNQEYLGTIPAGRTKEVDVNLLVAEDYNDDVARMNIEFAYASAGAIVTNNVTLNIPTYVSGEFISESIIVANNATVGVNSLVSIRCKNGGTTDIADAKLIITGNVEEESREISLPIIGAGKTCMQDYYVRFTDSGIQTLQMEYQYTDSKGVMYTVNCGEYKINVTNAATGVENGTVVVKQIGGNDSIMISFAMLVAAAIAIVATAVIYIKKHR